MSDDDRPRQRRQPYEGIVPPDVAASLDRVRRQLIDTSSLQATLDSLRRTYAGKQTAMPLARLAREQPALAVAPAAKATPRLLQELDEKQTALLEVIAKPYLESGVWPLWQYVDYCMDQQGLDARDILKSLPRVGAGPTGRPLYGFTFSPAGQLFLRDEDVIRLTVAAALPLPELRPSMASPFLCVLEHMIILQRQAVPSPTEVTTVWLDSAELAEAMPELEPDIIGALPDIMATEPLTWHGSSSGPNPPHDLRWRQQITREVRRYVDVTDLEGYVTTVCKIMEEQQKDPYASRPPQHLNEAAAANEETFSQGVLTPPEAPQSNQEYVDQKLINDLRNLDSSRLHTDKLVMLLEELNFNFDHSKPMACMALIRSVLDHVPPGFDPTFTSFTHVASNAPWGKTDKNYMKQLVEFRDSGNDVLHRQMGPGHSCIGMLDVPRPTALNAMLNGLVVKLKKD